jgi:flagellar biosynthetic protein FliP
MTFPTPWRWLCSFSLLWFVLALPAVEPSGVPLAPPAMDMPTGASAPDGVVQARPATVTEAQRAPMTGATSAENARSPAAEQVIPVPLPGSPELSISVRGAGDGLTTPVLLLLTVTVLAMAPAFLMMMTSFTRIIIVFGFVRRALGTQTLPPNQVLAGLALFLTLFIMAPTFHRVQAEAVQPYLAKTVTQEVALERAKDAVKDFMLRQTRKNDLALFIRLANEPRPKTAADVSFLTLVPAFITSELRTAFQMGFVIFLPFLVIDLVVSAVLMALGMMMLPPVVVSLPFKILLFCIVDGWTLLVQALVASYR